MKIIRTQTDDFAWYEFTYKGQNLLHWNLLTLLEDILFFFGVDLTSYFFNPNLN